MKTQRVKSKKTGETGWRFRYVHPVSGQKIRKVFWYVLRADADEAFGEHMKNLRRRKDGLPDHTGWHVTYTALIARFLREAPISSPRRREILKRYLELNPLKLTCASDFLTKGKLTGDCRGLLEKRTEPWVVKVVQQPLKQVTAWAAGDDVLPFDPLSAWKKLKRTNEAPERRAFLPTEIAAILKAAFEYDNLLKRKPYTALVFKALLLAGNRPTVVLNAKVGDLLKDRIRLPKARGCKRNGTCTLPPEFMAELREYLAARENPDAGEPLFSSWTDTHMDTRNLSHLFTRCMCLAFTRLAWPADAELTQGVDAVNVAHRLLTGAHMGNDGRKPTDPEKIAERVKTYGATEAVALKIKQRVEALMQGCDMYALRKTHISWARRLVNPDSVRVQVGHAGRDTEERHYLDLVDARESSQAVWNVLAGKASLNRESKVLRIAAGAEGMTQEPEMPIRGQTEAKNRTGCSKAAVKNDAKSLPDIGSPGWIRTINPVINSHMLYR